MVSFDLDGGIDLKKVMLAASIAMIILSLISCSSAQTTSNYPISAPAGYWIGGPNSGQTYSGYEEKNTTFDFEQSVQGNGYFMTYLYAKAGNSAFKNYAHGSGSLNSEATLTYQKLDKKDHQNYGDYNDFAQNCIQFKEDVAMVYAPMRIAVGTGYYAANPLDYSSLLKEKTWVKNYRAGTSMHHEVEYAHALDKELELVVKDKFNYTYDPVYEGVGYTQMKVVEDVTDGKAHIGVLQANTDFTNQMATIDYLSNPELYQGSLAQTKSAWHNPAIEIDEDYWGTYHIEKNMTLEVPYYKKTVIDDWLPCCFGGYLTLPAYELRNAGIKNAKGIFDCTCFKAPTVAEFPRTYPAL
jgi:hypothetical protein